MIPTPARSMRAVLVSLILLHGNAGSAFTLNDFLTRTTEHPPLTEWGPTSERLGSMEELVNPIIPPPDRFTTLHGGGRSTDEVGIVFAPVFERTWTAETGAFVTESPTFDQFGNAYFVPLLPTDNFQNMLIKLNGETGQREWAITQADVGPAILNLPRGLTTFPAFLGQGAAPLILNDPDSGRPVIYSGGYSKVYAADENGNILWSTPTIPVSLFVHRALPPTTHLFGVHYHPQTDSILYEYAPGDILAFDRTTGLRKGGIFLPGAPAASTLEGGAGSNLPEDVRESLLELVRQVFFDSFDVPDLGDDIDIGSRLADALLGGGSLIANDFAVDPNTNSIWVASTDLDEADGAADGVSEIGALYRIDLTAVPHPTLGERIVFTISCKASFEGGTTSTPAVSPDGLRIYTSDNQGRALAFDRNCNTVWSVDTGQPAVASLAVSSNVGAEIYYPTATSVIKIQESIGRNSAEVQWSADIASSFVGGRFIELLELLRKTVLSEIESRIGRTLPDDFVRIEANNLDLATIGQNGIMVHAGHGLKVGEPNSAFLLPVAMNIGLYDRDTGALINATPAIEENIGAMYTGPDGTIAMGSSPIRRLVIRALATAPESLAALPPELQKAIDFIIPPITGGVTKYGVTKRFDLVARDALCQAARIIKNTNDYAPGNVGLYGVAADRADTHRLIVQAENALPAALAAEEIRPRRMDRLLSLTAEAHDAVSGNNLDVAIDRLEESCRIAKRNGLGSHERGHHFNRIKRRLTKRRAK